MKSLTSLLILVLLAAFLDARNPCSTANATGIPEPGLILYGEVRNTQAPSRRVSEGKLTWTFKNLTTQETFTLTTGLANINDQFSYVLQVPAETVLAGLEPSLGTLKITASPTKYDLSKVQLNGADLSFADSKLSSLNFGSQQRGTYLRIDFTTSAAPESYEDWSLRYFGRVVLKDDDEDRDGLTNFSEYTAGTDPKDSKSVFEFITVTADPRGGFLVEWSSVAGRTYIIERSSDLGISDRAGITFSPVSTQPATGGKTSFYDSKATPPSFYRLRVQ